MARSLRSRLCTYEVVRIVLTLVAFFLFFYIVGQHSYPGHPKRKKTTSFHRSASVVKTTVVSSSCHRCSCDCLPEMDSVPMPLDFFNSSFSAYADCAKNHPEMNKEMKKDIITLLSEEINLRKNVTRNYLDSMQQSIIDVKRTTSKYQKEAEKCNTGVQICEEARERAEAALGKELKLSAIWEQRARESGWKDEST